MQVFLNGKDVSGGMRRSANCAYRGNVVVDVPNEVLKDGTNVLAIHAHDYGVATYFDAEVTADFESDTTPPTLTVPTEPYKVPAEDPLGATVDFDHLVSAVDDYDQDPVITCEPASPSWFDIGTTIVTCTATDDSGNTSAAASFDVIVEGPAEQLANLMQLVADSADGGIEQSLLAKLEDAVDALATEDPGTACAAVQDFRNQVAAQSGKKLTTEQAAELDADAERIATVLAC